MGKDGHILVELQASANSVRNVLLDPAPGQLIFSLMSWLGCHHVHAISLDSPQGSGLLGNLFYSLGAENVSPSPERTLLPPGFFSPAEEGGGLVPLLGTNPESHLLLTKIKYVFIKCLLCTGIVSRRYIYKHALLLHGGFFHSG